MYLNLKEFNHYPQKECLEICKNYKVIDAQIYLNLITGSINDALNLSLDTLNETYNDIINNLTG